MFEVGISALFKVFFMCSGKHQYGLEISNVLVSNGTLTVHGILTRFNWKIFQDGLKTTNWILQWLHFWTAPPCRGASDPLHHGIYRWNNPVTTTNFVPLEIGMNKLWVSLFGNDSIDELTVHKGTTCQKCPADLLRCWAQPFGLNEGRNDWRSTVAQTPHSPQAPCRYPLELPSALGYLGWGCSQGIYEVSITTIQLSWPHVQGQVTWKKWCMVVHPFMKISIIGIKIPMNMDWWPWPKDWLYNPIILAMAHMWWYTWKTYECKRWCVQKRGWIFFEMIKNTIQTVSSWRFLSERTCG